MKDLAASTKLEIYRVLGLVGFLDVSIKRLGKSGVAVGLLCVGKNTFTSGTVALTFTRKGRDVILPPLDKHAKVEILKSIARAIDAACADDEPPGADTAPHQSRRKGHRL